MKASSLKPHQRAILLAGLASVVIWGVPSLRVVMLPLIFLNTHIHEICHALTSLGTGGDVQMIEVFGNGSGVTLTRGGSALLISSAGYLGAALVGFGMVLASRTEAGTQQMLRVLALVLGAAMLLWLRGDGVGITFGVLWLGALVVGAQRLKGPTLLFAGQFLGVQQCLNSVSSVYDLLKITASTGLQSDAKNLEGITAVPAMAWAGLWCAVSVLLLMQGLRLAWVPKPPARSSRRG